MAIQVVFKSKLKVQKPDNPTILKFHETVH